MKKKNKEKKVISLLKSSIGILMSNKIILFPFCIIAFFELLVLEILYFIPRWPLNVFFGPIVRTLWGETFLHYPYNFVLLPKLYQYAQIPIYILISSFCIAVSIAIIESINDGKEIKIKSLIKENLKFYIHIAVLALISFILIFSFTKFYGVLYSRASQIRSLSGIYYIIKRTIIDGAPYFNLIFNVFISTIFAYVLPVIVIENKKIFDAIKLNFNVFFKMPVFTTLIVLIPSLFLIPVLLLRTSVTVNNSIPGFNVLTLILSIFIMLSIDAVVYTSITTYWLLKKESK